MSLRRRLFLVSLVYLAVVVVGGALVLRITTQRDDLVHQQRALVAAAPLDNAQQAELRAAQNRPGLSKEAHAHIADSLNTLEEALKAPMQRAA